MWIIAISEEGPIYLRIFYTFIYYQIAVTPTISSKTAILSPLSENNFATTQFCNAKITERSKGNLLKYESANFLIA